jgi:hypothetical protein
VALAGVAAALFAVAADAREVRVPLRLDYPFLRELLVHAAFGDPEQTARVYTDGVDCKHVVLSNPELRGVDGKLRVLADVDAKVGTLFVGICLFPIQWRGRIESNLEPSVDPAAPVVHFRVLDSRLLEPDGSPSSATTATVWEWLKGYVHPRLERFAVDLAAPMADLRAILPLFLAPASADRAEELVASLALERVAVEPGEVVLDVRFNASERSVPPPAPLPEPELSPEEVARFDEALGHWDGFITTVVKRAGTQSGDAALREQLFEVLMDAREELVAALEEPAQAGPDPVRPLFLASWQRLAGVLRELGPQLGDQDALRYLGFVAAADALATVDAVGPDLGFEFSSDGLRRLARVLAPEDPADPLDAPEAVDPELRRALDFGEPLPDPELPLDPEPAVEPEAAPPSEPPPDSPPAPAPPTSSLDWLLAGLRAFFAPTAFAATQPSPELSRDELARLRGWVPKRSELNEYLPLMDRLLRSSAQTALSRKAPPIEIARVYNDLQLATAWQETCWRHYVRAKGAVVTIRSHAGAVGLMQVNSRVWRGFYDPRFLLGDVSYNSRAGSEILLRYFMDLAYAKGEHELAGGMENLVHASYAAYNGGPSQLTRYRNAKTAKSLRAIDAGFFKKYQAVRAGRVMEVRSCFG